MAELAGFLYPGGWELFTPSQVSYNFSGIGLSTFVSV